MDVLIQALQAAGSQNIELVKQAEVQLSQWETNKGFFPNLLEVFLKREVEVNVRWIAIIYLKNGINKYWRRISQNGITEEEKSYIRDKITIFDETVAELALQVAVVIGRIARSDIKVWPDCLSRTLQAIKGNDQLRQHRGLMTLNQIVKELVSKRLASDRRVFQEISANIFSFLEELCYHYVAGASSNEDSSMAALEMAILITKILRKLLSYGAMSYEEESTQMRYVKWCLRHVNVFLEYRNSRPDRRQKFEKFLILLLKILSDFEENHSGSIEPVLVDLIQLCSHHILVNTNNSQENSTIIIYCGNLLRALCRRFSNVKKPSRCSDILMEVVTDEFLRTLSYHVVMNYFPLTGDELSEWRNDPEDFINVEAGESHKFLLRPCMETLYVGLFYGFKQFMCGFVVNLVNEVNQINLETASSQDLLKVCAIFKAVGLPSYELFDEINFDVWFVDFLLKIFNLASDSFSVLQQHVLWMIGEWVNVKLSKPNRVHLYKLISALLSINTTDLVLKLTACKTLRTAIDDFDFDLDDFQPFVDSIFPSMCRLLVTVDECDTKMMVLNVLSVTIERVGDKVHRNADMLLQYLPQLWQISEQHNLLRGAVVNVLHHLVKGLGVESTKINHLTIPVINHSTDVNQPAHIYLLEDGLELWQAVATNAATMPNELLSLYGNILPLLERASETLDVCLDITKTYLMIDAKAFLEECSNKLSQIFHDLLGYIKEDAASKIAAIFKLIIQLQPLIFLQRFESNVLDVFHQVIRDANYPPLMTKYISIIAYVVVHQSESFFKVGQVCGQMNNTPYEEMMGHLLDVWLEKIDCMPISEKKLSAIALLSLLPLKISFVGDRFALILDACINVLYDLQKMNAVDANETQYQDPLCVDWSKYSSDDDADESFVDSREKKLLSQDCVSTINLLEFLRIKLNEVKSSYGIELFNEAMSTIDSAVAKQLMSLLNT